MATTEKDIRLYQRGNDQVVLDNYINRLESGFNDWLDSKKLKDKQKTEVRQAYQEMIQALNNDPTSLTAVLGGGFENTKGWTNASKGFDKYGVAANYFGETLREMSTYKKPETKSTKIKYDRNSALITPEEQRNMLGTEYLSFINLDPYDEATQTRGIDKRIAHTVTKLNDILNNLENTREFETKEDLTHAKKRLTDAITALNDKDPNNDWFTLSQLGITNPAEWFYTGSIKKPEEEKPTTNNGAQFERFMQQYHPVYNGTFMQNLVLQPQTNVNTTAVQKMFDGLNQQQLSAYLNDYISNRNYNFIASPRFTQYFPNVNPASLNKLTPSDFSRIIINSLISKGIAKQFTYNGQQYYDLGFGPKDTNTSYVYNVNTNTISQIRQHEIPHWQQKFIDDYNSKVQPSQTNVENEYLKQHFPTQYQKEGGILKAQNGTSLNSAPSSGYSDIWQAVFYDEDTLKDANRYRYTNGGWTELRNSILATDTTSPNNGAYDPEGTFDETNENYKKWLNLLKNNEQLAEAWARRYKTLNNNTSPNVYANWFDASDKFNFENFKNSTIFSDGINGIGHDIYRGKVYRIIGQNGSPMHYNVIPEGYKIKTGEPTLHESGLFNIYDLTKASTEEQGEQPEGEEKPEETPESEEERKTRLGETVIPDMPEPSLISRGEKVLNTLGINSLRALRLASSLQSNEKINNTLKKAITPYLASTYELYSPTTGAFATRQFKDTQAAEARRLGSLPFTSDASLMAARMFEGNKQATALETEGFLADNQEIKRTQAESLRRAEDNIARRTAVANEDMKSIHDTNLQRAQLDATKLQKDFTSWDTFMKQIESDLVTNFANKQRETEAFATQVGEYNALDRRQQRLDQVLNAYMEYKKTHPGATVEEFNTHTNGGYSRAMKDIDDMYKYDMLKYYRGIKGYNINLPQQKTWRLSKYISSKNGGRLNLSTDYLINKVINESNT